MSDPRGPRTQQRDRLGRSSTGWPHTGPPAESTIHQRFPRIDPTAWEHPSDRAALDALRAVPGVDSLARLTIGRIQDDLWVERKRKAAVPAADHDPALAALWTRIQHVLDAPAPVPLYVVEGGQINGHTIGVLQPTIFLTEGTARLPEAELSVVLAHELGHVLSGHVTWKTIVRMLEAGRWWMIGLGPNLVLTLPVVLALQQWDRMSELSADRASLVVLQDLRPIERVLERAHAGQALARMERREKISQVTPVAADAIEALEGWFQTHPPVEQRLDEIRGWAAGDDFAAVLSGRYPRRGIDVPDLTDPQARMDAFTRTVQERARSSGAALAQGLTEAEARAKEVAEDLTRRGGAALDWLKKQGGSED